MFTGIISAVGGVRTREQALGREIEVDAGFDDANLGESIAVNGTCLTVSAKHGSTLTFFVSPETLDRTNLGELQDGAAVNLERALRLSDRLSGHLVQGHVDARAKLISIRTIGDSHELEVELPKGLARYVIEKGSIALDGISLTVNSVKNSTIYLMIIPHTWEHTTLKAKRIGQDFNVEVDMVAKYLEKLHAHDS